MIKNGMPPIHPGEILREEFLVPLQTDTIAFAEQLGVPASTVEAVVNECVPVTPELASKLAGHFKTSEGFWLSLQATYEERSAAVARQAVSTKPACGDTSGVK
nr:HigA family addiction module antitoxin [uncultured Pseudomonas sp.]